MGLLFRFFLLSLFLFGTFAKLDVEDAGEQKLKVEEERGEVPTDENVASTKQLSVPIVTLLHKIGLNRFRKTFHDQGVKTMEDFIEMDHNKVQALFPEEKDAKIIGFISLHKSLQEWKGRGYKMEELEGILNAGKQDATEKVEDSQEQREKTVLKNLILPFDEDDMKAWFQIPKDQKLPVEPRRMSNISPKQFYYFSTHGIPIIGTDTFKNWKAKKWNCEYFKEKYPDSLVDGWLSYDNEKVQERLGDLDLTFKNYNKSITANETNPDAYDPKNPTKMQYKWYPINIDKPATRNTKEAKELITEYSVPYFIPKTPLNNEAVHNRLEVFFGANQSGVQPHIDQICQFIFSAQASGYKRWRLSMIPSVTAIQKLNPTYRWQPPDTSVITSRILHEYPIYEFTLGPHETIFFPPGMIHGTKVIDNGDTPCSCSFSLQFADPPPMEYAKKFAAPFSYDLYGVGTCLYDIWTKWMFGHRTPDAPADGTKANNLKGCLSSFKKMDLNGNGMLNVPELKQIFKERFGQEHENDVFFNPVTEAQQFIITHDKNNDGKVSQEEFVTNCGDLWTTELARTIGAWNENKEFDRVMRGLWEDIDTNDDDVITRDEFFKKWPKLKQTDWDFCEEIDSDENGEISDGEYQDHLQLTQEGGAIYSPELSLLFTGNTTGLEKYRVTKGPSHQERFLIPETKCQASPPSNTPHKTEL